MTSLTLTHNGVCYWCIERAVAVIIERDGERDQACAEHVRQYLPTYDAPIVVGVA